MRVDGGTVVAALDVDGSDASLAPEAANVTLATVELRGVEEGDANLSVALRRFQDEDGAPVPAFAVADDLEVAYDRPDVTIDARWNRSGGSDETVLARNATELEFVLREVPEGGINGTTIDLDVPWYVAAFTGEYESSDDFSDTYLDYRLESSSEAVLTVANTNRTVEPGQENVSLGSVEVLGWQNGTATVDASVRSMWTADGVPVDANVTQPTLRVTTRSGRPDVDVRFDDRPIEPGETTNATVVLQEVPRLGVRHASWSMHLDGGVANFTGAVFSNESRFGVTLDGARTASDTVNVSLRPAFATPEPGAEDVVLGRFEVEATANGTTSVEFDGTGSTPVREFELNATSETLYVGNGTLPAFELGNVSTNSPATAGENLTVTANVTNVGDFVGTTELSLTVGENGTASTESVQVAGGSSAGVTFTWPTEEVDVGGYNATVSGANGSATVAVSVESAPDDSGGGGGGIALPGGGSDDPGDESDETDSDSGSENDSEGDAAPGSFDLTVDDATGPVVLQGEGASADATASTDVGASVGSVEVVAVEATAASSAESFQIELRAGDSSGPEVDGQVVEVLQVDGGGVLSDAMVTLSASADAVPEGANDDQLTVYTLVDGEWVAQSEGAAGEDLAANVPGSGAVAVVADDGEGESEDTSAGDGSSVPGFGVALAVLAIATALVGRARRSR